MQTDSAGVPDKLIRVRGERGPRMSPSVRMDCRRPARAGTERGCLVIEQAECHSAPGEFHTNLSPRVLAAAINSTVVAGENPTVGSTVWLPAESIAPGR